MQQTTINKSAFDFLKRLEQNNTREWFAEHKTEFKAIEADMKSFFNALAEDVKCHDEIDRTKIFRIYRDVRFSKNKTPYKINFSSSLSRAGASLRGGYYTHIQPNNASFIAGGFWAPEKDDLLRIRKEFELEADEFRAIINKSDFKNIWGNLQGDELKTAPRDFDKSHPNIDLIKKKSFVFTRKFTDAEVLSPSFISEVNLSFEAIRPYFDFMSAVLTTNLNGESLID